MCNIYMFIALCLCGSPSYFSILGPNVLNFYTIDLTSSHMSRLSLTRSIQFYIIILENDNICGFRTFI